MSVSVLVFWFVVEDADKFKQISEMNSLQLNVYW